MAKRTLRVVAHFHDHDGRALTGDDLRVELFDQDPMSDDKLGDVVLDPSGTAVFDFPPEAMRSFDSPLEFEPDLYFVVHRGDKEVFRSKVFTDVEFKKRHVSPRDEHVLVRAFGPFTVEDAE
jgi:hypothetical protein